MRQQSYRGVGGGIFKNDESMTGTAFDKLIIEGYIQAIPGMVVLLGDADSAGTIMPGLLCDSVLFRKSKLTSL
ncbi:hypothetical protein MASR1M12_37840 [Erysipelotrichia bacterium]